MPFDLDGFTRSAGVEDIQAFHQKCASLLELIHEYNRRINITRISSEHDYWNKHVADSLALGIYFPAAVAPGLRLADVGCGAGFPSLVLACAYPGLEVFAIDSVRKKTSFVSFAAAELGLDNITVLTGRSNELQLRREWQGTFDVVTARAVAAAAKLFREVRLLPGNKGMFIFYKTPSQLETDLPEIIKESAGSRVNWETSREFTLPGGDGVRQFLYARNRS